MEILKVSFPKNEMIVTRNRFIVNHIFPLYIRNTKDKDKFVLTFYCRQDYDDSVIFLEMMLIENNYIKNTKYKKSKINIDNKENHIPEKYKSLIEECKESSKRYVTDLYLKESEDYSNYFYSFCVKSIDSKHVSVLDIYFPRDNFIRVRKYLKELDHYFGKPEDFSEEIFFSSKYHNLKFYNITKIIDDGTKKEEKIYYNEKFTVCTSHFTMYSEITKFRMNCVSLFPKREMELLKKYKLRNPLHHSIYDATYSKDYCATDYFLGEKYLYIIYDPYYPNLKPDNMGLYVLRLLPEQFIITAFANKDFIFEKGENHDTSKLG